MSSQVPAKIRKDKTTAAPLGKILSRRPCGECHGMGFRSANTSLSEGIAGEFHKCKCDGGYIYTRAEVPKM